MLWAPVIVMSSPRSSLKKDSENVEARSQTSNNSDCEEATEAALYRDVLISLRFNDCDLPFKLKDIIMSELRLLTLLEAGLPSWVYFFPVISFNLQSLSPLDVPSCKSCIRSYLDSHSPYRILRPIQELYPCLLQPLLICLVHFLIG